MSNVGSVSGTPAPRPEPTTVTADTPVDTAAPAAPVSRTPSSARPTAPAAPPKASDIVPASILEKYGLDPNKMTTESKYNGPAWSVGYYPYTGDVQYVAFGKHGQVFGGEASKDAHAYFESYSNPPSGLSRGSWIADGTVDEANFEAASGVDINGDRPIDNQALKLLREAGASNYAEFALRDANGKQIPLKAGDRLVPTVVKDGKAVEVGDTEASGGGVVWRVRSQDGSIRYDATDKVEDRATLAGASDGVSFDFLDARGEMVPYDPRRDRIVPGFAEGDKWHVLAKGPGTPPTYEHQVMEGGRVASTEQLSEEQAKALMAGKEIIHRVQNRSSGALGGDGKVNNSFDMSWWGKCHNVASIGTSNMARPKEAVRVVTNLEAGETLGLRFGDNVLKPARDAHGAITGYTHEVRAPGGGAVESSRPISIDEAKSLAGSNQATATIVKADGSLKEARFTTFNTRDVDALVSHIGDGAVVSKGGEGARYYAYPDILVLKDGKQLTAHVKSVETESGKTLAIGSRSGTDYLESDRAPLRGPGMSSRVLSDGSGRRYAFNIQDMAKLNEYRDDDIKKLTVIHPDGREETIDASNVQLFAWENKFDFRPDQLWNLHKTVTADGSTVIEQDPGTHVWNYTIGSVDTTPLKAEGLSAREKERAALPGMMAGTVGDEGKYFFETKVNYNTYRYWARFDDQGTLKDYGYLTDSVPDFVWTQHVKNAFTDRWTGESQAPGVMNGDIQRVYVASLGGLSSHTLPGGFISTGDLKTAPAKKPEIQ